MRKAIVGIMTLCLLLASSQQALAHVTVKPSTVGVGSFQTFTVGVPNERDVPTTQIRLVLPDGLNHVMPNAKPGWEIEVIQEEKDGGDETEEEHDQKGRVTEIIWSGGVVPVGFREDFQFSAQVPVQETTLVWRAYQTYEDGSVVSWDLEKGQEQPTDSEGKPDFSSKGPASMTMVADDLAQESLNDSDTSGVFDPAYLISILALGVAFAALYLQLTKKK